MLLFPYKKVREVQEELIETIHDAIVSGKNLVAHAPTGLGKTVAALAPALPFVLKNGMTIFFLTSRHTQHTIAIETLKDIKKKHNKKFYAVDIIGKKWMCPVQGVEQLYSSEFTDYCKKMKEENKCEFYSNTRKSAKLTVEAKKTLEDLKNKINHTEELLDLCSYDKLCAYEIAMQLAKQSNIIVADYYYVFHPTIMDTFFKKSGKELSESIVIVDEGHNLPGRIRDLATERITSLMLRRAIQEAKKFGNEETIKNLVLLQNILLELSAKLVVGEERLVNKEEFMKRIEEYDDIIAEFERIAEFAREKQKQSYIGGVARFLQAWQGTDEGFTRILSLVQGKKEEILVLSYRCLDPSVVTSDVIAKTHSTIMFSGTLTPTYMYKDLLGMDAIEKTYPSPFPSHNRLNLVVPKTTTKFTKRSQEQYKNIAEECSKIVDAVPGNCLVFFPSYFIRDQVVNYLKTGKKIFLEKPNMTKEDKTALLEKFKRYKKLGSVLMCAISGNFGEGIDLPGELLKAVVVVGLPLTVPDLETKELIRYYEKKFGRGWDYGYLFPAFNKCLQSAGRCIRSETDKGVVVFLDERYIWPMYKRCFPEDMELKVSKYYVEEIEEFFQVS